MEKYKNKFNIKNEWNIVKKIIQNEIFLSENSDIFERKIICYKKEMLKNINNSLRRLY